jgi:hypothetical protein
MVVILVCHNNGKAWTEDICDKMPRKILEFKRQK